LSYVLQKNGEENVSRVSVKETNSCTLFTFKECPITGNVHSYRPARVWTSDQPL